MIPMVLQQNCCITNTGKDISWFDETLTSYQMKDEKKEAVIIITASLVLV